MTYHRLALPSYFIPGGGSLPAGYDLLNDPVAGGTGTGIPTPADTADKVGGTYDGTYFIAEGENANAFDLNRPSRAIGENTDILDNLFHRDLATPTSSDFTAGGGGAASANLNGSTTNIYVGSSAFPVGELFQVLDQTERPIYVNGAKVVVSSITGAAIGSGFTSANPLTVNFSATIPSGVQFRVFYTVRNTLAAIADSLFAMSVGRRYVNTDTYSYDHDVVTVSDNVSSTGGDFNAAIITSLLDGATQRGELELRPGAYEIDSTTDWTFATRVKVARPGTATIAVKSTRSTKVLMTEVEMIGVGLKTASTTTAARFEAAGDFTYQNTSLTTFVEAGSLFLNGVSPSYSHRISGLRLAINSTLTASDSGLKVSGTAALSADNCSFEQRPSASGSVLAVVYVDSYTGRAVIRNARIVSNFSGIDALRINNSANTAGRIEFEDCVISMTDAGDAWALRITDSTNVVFRNCRFFSEYGQVIRVQNSGVTFEDCTFESGTTTSLTNPQMICGEGNVSGSNQENALKFINCRVIYNAANVRDTGAPTKPIIELGGRNAASQPGRVVVDGLYIRPDSGSVLSHQFTAVLLHSHASLKSSNVYRNITIDELTRTPTGAGTLGRFDSGFLANALVVEAVGGTSVDKLKVQNLSVVNVKAPATSLARGIVGLNRVQAEGVTIDGSTSSAGSFNKPILQVLSTTVGRVHFFPTAALEMTSYALLSGTTSTLREIRYHHRGINTTLSAPIIGVGSMCAMHGSFIYLDVGVTSTSPVIEMAGYATVHGSTVIINGTLTGGSLVSAGGADDCILDNSVFRWANNAADNIANFSNSDRSVVIGNRFLSTAATAPAVTLTGTVVAPNGIDVVIGDVNIIAANAANTTPTVY